MSQNFTHLDAQGNPNMVDVGDKNITTRTAKARGIVVLEERVLAHFSADDIHTKKGAVFQTAILAGLMAIKKTPDLIPLCHQVGLDKSHIEIYLNSEREVVIECTAKATAKTGVEMEALTGVSVAALTIYDMCKGFSHHIIIKEIRLLEKTGGKTDFVAA
ncbi:MAG: cyclic pyranopterin monophosphate synthase MoaC [Saprospiraceae bacterium]|nr:cyclic pyranopterin monophosphate synthase MoaC [Saprospiraceae bacterium]